MQKNALCRYAEEIVCHFSFLFAIFLQLKLYECQHKNAKKKKNNVLNAFLNTAKCALSQNIKLRLNVTAYNSNNVRMHIFTFVAVL